MGSEAEEEVEQEKEPVYERQDLFVIFTSERELRNIDQVRVKISQFTGIVMRTKTVSDSTMHNLFEAIEQDAAFYQETEAKQAQASKGKSHRLEMHGLELITDD